MTTKIRKNITLSADGVLLLAIVSQKHSNNHSEFIERLIRREADAQAQGKSILFDLPGEAK